jgi:hypothetical protein
MHLLLNKEVYLHNIKFKTLHIKQNINILIKSVISMIKNCGMIPLRRVKIIQHVK